MRAVPGVAGAQGQVVRLAALVSPAGRFLGTDRPTYGYSWPADAARSPFALVAGRAPERAGEAVLDRTSAAAEGLGLGDRLRVSIDVASPQPAVIVGLVDPRAGGDLTRVTSVFISAPWAQQLTGIGDRWDLLELTAAAGIGPDVLRTRAAAALPSDGTSAITSREYADAEVENLTTRSNSITTILLALSVLALLVGSAVILNTHRVLVAQRTRELAMLRILGATRRQLYVLIIGEAAVVGLVASCIGALSGIPLSYLLRGVIALAGQDSSNAPLDVEPLTLALTVVLGTVVATAIAMLPAARATRLPPLAAVRHSTARPPPPVPRLLTLATAGLAVAGAVAIAVGIAGPIDMRFALVIAGGAAVGLAIVAALPMVAAPALRVLGSCVSRTGGAGMVARANVLRNPRRTAAPAAALVVGLGLVSAVSVLAASAGGSVDNLVRRADRADLVVVSDAAPGLDPEAVSKLREAPGIAVVSSVGSESFTVDGRSDVVTAIEPETAPAVLSFTVVDGSTQHLDVGSILVTHSAALAHGYKVGDVVLAKFSEPQTYALRIAGIIEDNGITRDWVISWDTYGRGYHIATIRAAFLRARPGISQTELRNEVNFGVTGFPGIQVDNADAFAQAQAQAVQGPVALIEALVGLSIIVALLGVMNTVGLSVIERTTELGLLRVVGMSRTQVSMTVYLEAAMTAVLGVVVGVSAGLAIGVTIVVALGVQGITEIVVPWAALLIVGALVVLGALVAALLPARRAARLGVLEAAARGY
jgi:putative ABC transport system permease protein